MSRSSFRGYNESKRKCERETRSKFYTILQVYLILLNVTSGKYVKICFQVHAEEHDEIANILFPETGLSTNLMQHLRLSHKEFSKK